MIGSDCEVVPEAVVPISVRWDEAVDISGREHGEQLGGAVEEVGHSFFVRGGGVHTYHSITKYPYEVMRSQTSKFKSVKCLYMATSPPPVSFINTISRHHSFGKKIVRPRRYPKDRTLYTSTPH
jgi:hypothetical protein